MPKRPIRSVITTLTIATWTCIQLTNVLSAQDSSSRRMRAIQAPTPTVSIPDRSSEPLAKLTADERVTAGGSTNPRQQTIAALYAESPGSELQVTRTTQMQPAGSILPAAYVADQVPVPSSLADPEMFRVHPADQNVQADSRFSQVPHPEGSYSSLPVRQDRVTAHPAGYSTGNFVLPQQESKNEQLAAAKKNEDSLLDRLPISNLYEGVVRDPVTQANVRQTVGDPYLASRSYGGNLRAGAAYTPKTWRSPNMAHRPLYFEEANLERYGHTHPRLQPLLSGVHFFSSVAFLPYKSGVTPPTKCQYSIGYNRPGDCVPTVREQHPFNPRGAFRQAAVFTAGFVGL